MCASPPPAPSPTNPPTHPQALIHFILEGSFVYLATFGRAVSISSGPFPALWMEYACGDVRWAHADLTVLAAGPLCVYMLILLAKGGPAYHYCVVVLGTAEIYGRCMTFVPKGLAGSLNLLTSSWMYAWVYLFFVNFLWIWIPSLLMYDSYRHIASSLRLQSKAKAKQA